MRSGIMGTVAALAIAAGAAGANAATITFAPATTISGDTDVATAGTLVFADNLQGSATTINGVPFVASNSRSGDVATLTDGTITATGTNNMDGGTNFGSGNAPYSALSTSYQALLGTAYFDALRQGGGSDWTVALTGLTVGHSYEVQLFSNDSRNLGRSETVSGGGNSVTLTQGGNPSPGGNLGQFTTGSFTADSASQSFSIVSTSSNVVNGIQLRDVTAVPEPATLAIAGLCAAGLLLAKRRKTRMA